MSKRHERLDLPMGFIAITVFTVASLLSVSSEAATPLFAARYQSVAVVSSSRSLAVADLNGDGFDDAVTTDEKQFELSGTLSVCMGQGDGGLESRRDYPMGPRPIGAVIADLDDDGWPDVVCSSNTQPNLSGRFGSATGILGPMFEIPILGNLSDPKFGDLNGDHFADLVGATTWGGDAVAVRFGDGTGGFSAPVTYASLGPGKVLLADWNSDGQLDVALLRSSRGLSTWLNTGGGVLGPRVDVTTSSTQAVTASAAFMNDDTHLDLVMHSFSAVSIQLGNGNGTFQPRLDKACSGNCWSLETDDIDGDGAIDVLVGTFEGEVKLLRGNGDGSVDFPVTLAVPGSSARLGRCDLDPNRDLLAASPTAVRTATGRGDGSFGFVPEFGVLSGFASIAVGDLNGDLRPDIVVADGGPFAAIYLADGPASFAAPTTLSIGTGADAVAVAIGDATADGRPDIAVASDGANHLDVFVQSPAGTFDHTWTGNAIGPAGLAFGDFNLDSRADLVVTNRSQLSVTVYMSAGNGTYDAGNSFAVGHQPGNCVVADMSGDGAPDIVVPNHASANSGTVSVLLGRWNGTFFPHSDYFVGGAPNTVDVADVDGDGLLDTIVSDDETVRVLRGTGGGALAAPTVVGPGIVGLGLDVNADGRVDIVTSVYGAPETNVYLNAGDLVFATGRTCGGVAAVARGDFDADGDVDLVGRSDTGKFGLLLRAANPVDTSLGPPPSGLRLSWSRQGASFDFKYSVPGTQFAQLAVYDVRGRLLWKTTSSGGLQRQSRWDATAAGSRLARGVYFVELRSAGSSLSRKLVWRAP